MASGDNEYYDYGEGDGDTECYQSASDDDAGGGDDGGFSDDDYFMYEEEGEEGEEEEGEDQLQEVENMEKMYGALAEDAVLARQDECTARVADLISLPPAFAVVVLRHCKWSANAVVQRWFSDEEQQRIRDAVCECKHAFCLNCGEEAHGPVACDMVAEWLAKHSSDGETANWVLANTKHCPECRRPIEKNMGCMHMTCTPPCRHEFCWLCLGPWSTHSGSGYYNCNRYSAARQEGKFTKEEVRRQQAKVSSDKYLHYYERWAAHEQSRQKALEDLAGLQLGTKELQTLAAVFGVVPTKLAFVAEAYVQIAECRRQLQWTYAYGYYLPGDTPAVKRELLECLQSDAEASLERLHGCAEKERRDLVYGADDPRGMYSEYEQKLAHLTRVTRNHFENLVTALENDLAEVKVIVEGTHVRRAIATDDDPAKLPPLNGARV